MSPEELLALHRRPAELVLVAGPNGSGKSTLVDRYVPERFPLWPRLNADRVARELSGQATPPRERSLEAASLVDSAARCLALLGSALVLETVLASLKYQPLVAEARRVGLLFRLVYVTTLDPRLNVERVRQRVAAGGHDVPEDKVRERWHRSLENLPWFAACADRLLVVDNSAESWLPLALRHRRSALEILVPRHPASRRLEAFAGTLALPG